MTSSARLLKQTGSSGSEGLDAVASVDQIPHIMSHLWLVTGPVYQQAAYRLVRLIVKLSSAVLSS